MKLINTNILIHSINNNILKFCFKTFKDYSNFCETEGLILKNINYMIREPLLILTYLFGT
jgi:hypothetical protein